MATKPVASWADYGLGIIVVCDNGQVYRLPFLEDGRLVGTEWLRVGPPVPGTAFDPAIQTQLMESFK